MAAVGTKPKLLILSLKNTAIVVKGGFSYKGPKTAMEELLFKNTVQ